MKKKVRVTGTQTRIAFVVVDTGTNTFLLEVTENGLSPFVCEANGEFDVNDICEKRDETAVRTAMEEVVARLGIQASAVQTVMRIKSHVTENVTSVSYVFIVYASMEALVSSDCMQVLSLSQRAEEGWCHLSPVHRGIILRAINKIIADKKKEEPELLCYACSDH
jgi:hypothetical protein